MKKICLLLGIFSALNIYAENVKMKLSGATVFFSGAELTHTATVALNAGENTVTLEGLSPVIDLNSLKINVSNSIVVSSSEFSTDFLVEKSETERVKKLQDSINACNAEMAGIQTSIDVNTTAYQLLKKGIETNLSVVEKGKTTAEITQNLDYYSQKANTFETAIYDDKKKQEKLTETLSRLNAQLEQESSKNTPPSGILKLTLLAPVSVNASVTVTYYTLAASWTPYYDMNIASTDKPVVLQRRSKVRQTTGLDWEKVKITLSTAQPSRGKDAPLFQTWFLNYVSYAPLGMQHAVTQNTISYAQPAVSQDQLEVQKDKPQIFIRGTGSTGDSEPLILVDGVPVEGNYLQSISPEMIANFEILKDESATAIYGSRAVNGVILVTTKQMDDYVISEEKQISEEYKIDLPYTIPGNGKEQIIDLTKHELQASYKYYCAPKLDANVYLIAEFTDWEKLNLLSGLANITYDGTFVGQTFLNTQSAQKVLSVTLGTDKNITVKREKMTDFSSVKLLSSDTKVTLTYKISVKNNQNKPVYLVLKDQYPISQQKDIEVEFLKKETTEPTFNREETGVVTWETNLSAGESKEYRIAYSVKYPKGRQINL
ncbi:MAG: DUF4139 domain-containing protein [Tannerella sp.]|jgi:TonB-dependent SusC/RagA subfamily outer membrane receptor|nr:DUF4139 domain-containing protein [Tannerella sp.]